MGLILEQNGATVARYLPEATNEEHCSERESNSGHVRESASSSPQTTAQNDGGGA